MDDRMEFPGIFLVFHFECCSQNVIVKVKVKNVVGYGKTYFSYLYKREQ